jgi:phosphopantetheinyl transferase (holo-ACP synthase)
MIGNDIVDLHLADRKAWRRKRFIEKILVPSEQGMLRRSKDPGRFLWLLWSMKESTYKIHFRKHLNQALNPAGFVCSFDRDFKGRVEADDTVYDTQSQISDDYIHTIATEMNSAAVIKMDELSAESFDAVRNKTIHNLIRSFAIAIEVDSRQVNFQKDKDGLPFLSHPLQDLSKPCSISHHGRFGAYAIAI